MRLSNKTIGILVYTATIAGRFIMLFTMQGVLGFSLAMLVGANIGIFLIAWGEISSGLKGTGDWVDMILWLVLLEVVAIFPSAIDSFFD